MERRQIRTTTPNAAPLLVGALGLLTVDGACAKRDIVSISEDGLTAQERSSGQVSAHCVVYGSDLKCWHLELNERHELLLMLRQEFEPSLPLPPVNLGSSTRVTHFETRVLTSSRCAALLGEGVKCWGYNEGGGIDFDDHQLGLPDPSIVLGDTPDEYGEGLPFVDLGATDVASVAKSQYGFCALFESGRVKCWGAGNPTLGLEDLEDRGDDPAEMGHALPYLDLGQDVRAVGIEGRFTHVCIWTDEGRVKCWGYNEQSQLGTAPSEPVGDGPGEMGDALPFVDLGDDFFAIQVTTGTFHSCALSDHGGVKCWGANSTAHIPEAPNYEEGSPRDFGRLGLGNKTPFVAATGDALPFVDLGSQAENPVVAIAAGSNHTCALFDTGKIKCWGSGGAGRLGYESRENVGDESGEMGHALPFVDLGDRVAVKLGCESGRSCALMADDTVLCWGSIIREGEKDFAGAVPGTMGNALIPVATAEELGEPG